MLNEPAERPKRKVWGWLFAILIPLAIGIPLSFLIPQPIVGVIYLDDSIYSTSAQQMIEQITYAREHNEIRAVVIVMNSPGGTVVDTESIYLELARLRQEKPVITVVEGMAASGGYYLSVGTDYIYAKPTSLVGNIGIIGYLPSYPSVDEEYYSTGPYKLTGYSRDQYMREMEMLKQSFWQAVQLGRGSKLIADQEEVLSGQIWFGSQALKMGIIDEIGTQSQAFDKAASLAKIAHYRTEDLRELADIPAVLYGTTFYGKTAEGNISEYPVEPGYYFLYVHQQEEQQ